MTKRYLLDLLERAGTTALEAAITFLIGAQTLGLTAVESALLVAVSTFLTVVRVGLNDWLRSGKRARSYRVDLLVRTVSTYLVVFLPAVISNPAGVSSWKIAAVSAIAPALAVVKGFLAQFRGNPNDASLVDLDAAGAGS
jgi:hypothetical protein